MYAVSSLKFGVKAEEIGRYSRFNGTSGLDCKHFRTILKECRSRLASGARHDRGLPRSRY